MRLARATGPDDDGHRRVLCEAEPLVVRRGAPRGSRGLRWGYPDGFNRRRDRADDWPLHRRRNRWGESTGLRRCFQGPLEQCRVLDQLSAHGRSYEMGLMARRPVHHLVQQARRLAHLREGESVLPRGGCGCRLRLSCWCNSPSAQVVAESWTRVVV